MILSTVLVIVNTLALIVGVFVAAIFWYTPEKPVVDLDEVDTDTDADASDSSDTDEDGGWEDFDPDAPLDLPPGVYVLPPEPVTA